VRTLFAEKSSRVGFLEANEGFQSTPAALDRGSTWVIEN